MIFWNVLEFRSCFGFVADFDETVVINSGNARVPTVQKRKLSRLFYTILILDFLGFSRIS